MGDGHHDWKTDIGLRLCGVTSCGLSCLSVYSLIAVQLADGQLSQGALPFFLAAAGFLCASAGAVLLSFGHHIFDQVEISPRWRTKPPARPLEVKALSLPHSKDSAEGHPSRFAISQDNTRAFDLIRRA